jgi:pimeloyl-ACP methyl ester carboxylesterase
MSRRRRTLVVLSIFAVALVAGGWLAMAELTDLLLFPYKPMTAWKNGETPACDRQWLVDYGFADLRVGAKGVALDQTCLEGVRRKGEDVYAPLDGGGKVHMRIYPRGAGVAEDAPLWLHVHGVSSNFLHGTRYAKAAERLGLQLVAMDLENHGLSSYDGLGAAYGCKEARDVVAAFAWLRERYPTRDVLLTATSMGTMVVLDAAGELLRRDDQHHLLAVALESAIPSVERVVLEGKTTPLLPQGLLRFAVSVAGRRAGYDFATCAPIDHAKDLQRPTLVQIPEDDELLPESLPRAVAAALPQATIATYPRARHSLSWNYDPEQFEADLATLVARGKAAKAAATATP